MFEVTLTVEQPAPEGQLLALPAWIPGSYMIREFSRNIVRIRAESDGAEVRLAKVDKHTWRAAPVAGKLTVVYEVYAWDLSRVPARGRTAPSVSNAQEIDIYVATANGWYRYDPDAPALLLCDRAYFPAHVEDAHALQL
eukprot:gene21924-24859_t